MTRLVLTSRLLDLKYTMSRILYVPSGHSGLYTHHNMYVETENNAIDNAEDTGLLVSLLWWHQDKDALYSPVSTDKTTILIRRSVICDSAHKCMLCRASVQSCVKLAMQFIEEERELERYLGMSAEHRIVE